MVELKLVGEILLILFFVIIIVLLVNLIIPKGAETISKLTGEYVKYVETLTKGCEEGEIKNECLSCGKYGFGPNHTICEEKKGKYFFCNDDGYCKQFECPPPCDPDYEICDDKNRCNELKPNACYYLEDCHIYLIPPEDETTENYAGYVHLYKNGKAYAIIPCYKTGNEYACVVKKELLELGQCYTGKIYWQTNFISVPKLICAIDRKDAKNKREIEITYADYKDWIKKFECKYYQPDGWWKVEGRVECEIEFSSSLSGIVYLQGYDSTNRKTLAPFFSSYNDTYGNSNVNSNKIDGKKVNVKFTGFEKDVGKIAGFSFLAFGGDKIIFTSLPRNEVISKFECAKKDEKCLDSYIDIGGIAVYRWSKVCCLNEDGEQYKCTDADPGNPLNPDSYCR